MATEFRKTGISVVGDVPWGSHFCHFYETKQDLLDTLVPYFKAGLESKEFCVWVVSDSELITVAEAKGALEQAVPDLDRHLADENIEILNGLDWYLEENVFNVERVTKAWEAKLKRALARGYDGMRVAGDTFWLQERDWKDFCAYEKQLSDSITDHPMTVLCTYPLAKSGAGEVLDVVQSHQFAIARRQGEWEVIQSPEPIQARAEIRRLNEELQRVPDGMPERPAIVRYGVAAVSVIAAVVILWLMDTNLQAAAHISLFLCAVIFSTCFGGIRPGLLSILLSILAFAYVLPPSDSLAVNISHLPRLLLFAPLAFFVAWLIAAQQSKAESLRLARDVLYETVQELKRTNVALEVENAERKRSEDALRRSEDRNRLIIDTIPTMAWSLQPEGAIDFVNQRWMDYTGLSLEQAIAEQTRPMHPEDLPTIMAEWCANMAAGEPFEGEMRLRRADGEYRWFLVRTVPLRDEQGKIVKWYGTSADIEDRQRIADALRESVRVVIDTIPMMAWRMRPDGSADFGNQRSREYTGLSPEQALEGPRPTVHPEDLPTVMEKWLADMAAGRAHENEMRLRRADGEYRSFLVRSLPLRDEQGNIVKWDRSSIDIEDRKRAEDGSRQSAEELS